MNGFDIFSFIGYVFAIALLILGLGVLLVTYRSTRKSIIALRNRNFGPSRNGFLAWVALTLTSFGLFFVIVTLHSESVRRDSAQLLGAGLVTSFLFIFGAISANFISLPPQLLKPSTWLTKRIPALGWISRHKLVSLVILLVSIFLLSQAYGGIVERDQRKKFEEARVQIDNIYAQIVSEIGPPDNHKIENSCSIQQQEFITGPTSCDVALQIVYGVTNQAKANEMLRKIQNILGRNKLESISNVSKSLNNIQLDTTTEHVAQDYYTFESLGCNTLYTYDTPNKTTLKNVAAGLKPFQISIDCGGPAKRLYFPEQD